MRIICLSLLVALGSLAVLSCGGGGGIASSDYNPGYGPFDANGNYVEEWADKPAKKHWWAQQGDTPATATAAATEPAPTALAANTSPSRAPGTVASPGVTSLAANPSRPAAKPATQPATTTVVTHTAPKPTMASVPKPASKPKPKPQAVKPKKPAPVRHVVKTGDTLYALSRKYGTSVSAIQKANNLKGTTIVDGKTILIPR